MFLNQKKEKPFYERKGFWILVIIVIVFIISKTEKSDTSNSSNESNQVNYENRSQNNSYSGVYYDLDQSTGWETTITISGDSFYGKTITPTGEVIASGSGKVDGNNLIDTYGQNIGSVNNSSLSIKFGTATISCQRR